MKLDLVSNKAVLHDNSNQTTPDSLASKSVDATVVQTENPIVTLSLGKQIKPPTLYKAND